MTKKAAKPRSLRIEFAGICTLVWNDKTVEVRLVDLSSAGFERHYAALALAITQSTPRGIKGPSADAAVSMPGEDTDVGLWNLIGADVEILGATGKLTVDAAKVDTTKKPGKNATSIRWLADIGFLCESNRLDPACPTATIITIPAGHVSASGAKFARKLEFLDDGQPVSPPRYCLPRFQVEIPFATELAIRLSRERVLRFTESMSVMFSNTCVCGLGVGPTPNHFYGHYEVVTAKRRPQVQRAGPQPTVPWYPEICYPSFVQT